MSKDFLRYYLSSIAKDTIERLHGDLIGEKAINIAPSVTDKYYMIVDRRKVNKLLGVKSKYVKRTFNRMIEDGFMSQVVN